MATLPRRVYKAKERELKFPFFYVEELPEFMQQREKVIEQVVSISPAPDLYSQALPIVWRG